MKFDREKAELSSENKLSYAYQNGALAMRIKFLKEQSALVKLGIDEATKEQKTIEENTYVVDKNTAGKEKNTKKTINLYQTEEALAKAFEKSADAATKEK